MINCLLTGSTGFVGKNLVQYFGALDYINVTNIDLRTTPRLEIPNRINCVIHLAGKAHDLRNTSDAQSYYQINTYLSKAIFDNFLASDAKVFLTLSSVKAVSDKLDNELTENHVPNPMTHYGKSKLLAEQYILSQEIPLGKRVYILRPCMVHGKGNKGNLNLLYKLILKGIPWPLGAFENNRSFCSIDNLMFIIKELIEREDIPSGVYNIADDDSLSTNEVISIIAKSQRRKPIIWEWPKSLIYLIARVGDLLKLPLNTERLTKLTESYVVDNDKIKLAIGKPLPISAKEGLYKTFESFKRKKV